MQRAINQLVTDVERMSNHYNQSEQARIAAANVSGWVGGGDSSPAALPRITYPDIAFGLQVVQVS
jgi:hypothetical protein